MDAPISTLEFCLYLLLIINNIYFWVAYIIVCLLFKSILSGTIAYFLLEASETSKLRHCIFPSTLFKMHVLKSIVHFELFYVKGIICEVSKFRILKNICWKQILSSLNYICALVKKRWLSYLKIMFDRFNLWNQLGLEFSWKELWEIFLFFFKYVTIFTFSSQFGNLFLSRNLLFQHYS